jgi:hypothetical protein
MFEALPYESPKKSKVEEAREVNVKEFETRGSEFKLSKAEISEEIWVY